MKFHIHYRPVFTRAGKFNGYEMFYRAHELPESREKGMDKLTFNYSATVACRIQEMINSLDALTEDGIYFCERHPLEIVDYALGKKNEPKRSPNWEQNIEKYKINARGELV